MKWRCIPASAGSAVCVRQYSRWGGQISQWVRESAGDCRYVSQWKAFYWYSISCNIGQNTKRRDEKISEGEVTQHASNNIYETSLSPAYPPIPPIPSTQLPYLLSPTLLCIHLLSPTLLCLPLLMLWAIKGLWTALLIWLLKSHAHEESSRRLQEFRMKKVLENSKDSAWRRF